MSANQSDLSSPKYGYDLVVAVSQASLNATMEYFMANLTAPQVIEVYVYESATSTNIIPISYADLMTNAKNSDPFSVPDGADPTTNQDLINLAAANYAGGFKATLGLPNVDPSSLPPIVTLTQGTQAPVLFNLLCSDFQITGFEYARSGATWLNKAQPADGSDLWYFSANVNMNPTAVDTNAPPASTPQAVKDRIQHLNQDPKVGPNAFGVQQLLLDLDTAILQTTPTIQGIPAGWAVWQLISTIFLGSYFTQMKTTGQPVFGYSVAMTPPDPSTMQLGALSYECCALSNNGAPITNPTPAQQAATTFNYLGTQSATPPTAVLFPWNWVELGDVSSFAGIQSVRQGVFVNFFAGLLNEDIAPLCQATTVSLTHDGDTYSISYYSNQATDATSFQPVTGATPGTDGYTEVLSLSYQHNSSDDSEAADHLSHIYGNFNYNLTGSVAFNGSYIRLVLAAQAYMEWNHHELGINYTDLAGANYYDKVRTVIYQLGVTDVGDLTVTSTASLVDKSAAWNFTPKGIFSLFGGEDGVKEGLTQVQSDLGTYLDDSFAGYQTEVTNEINNYHAWVFPGASSFTFKDISFSDSQDLTTELTYANPSLTLKA